MFYRLTCPNCRKTADHLFLRTGAVAACPSCAKPWRIEPGHVHRLSASEIKTGQAEAVDAAEPVESPRVPPPRTGPTSSGDTAMVGLSGLSEVMRPRSDRASADESTQGPPEARLRAAAPADPPSPKEARQQAGRQRAQDAERRRRRRTLLTLVLGLTVMVGLLGAVVALMAAKEKNLSTPGTPDVGASLDLSIPERAATAMPLNASVLADPPRQDVRAIAQLGDDPARLTIRLIATQAQAPAPIELVITAVGDAAMTHAWHLTETRALTRGHDLHLVALLPTSTPATDGDTRWIVTALQLVPHERNRSNDPPAP